MSTWENTDDMAKALATVEGESTKVADAPAAPNINPQAAGWVAATGYDYETYNKSTKELHEAMVAAGAPSAEEVLGAVGAITPGDWSGNATVYEWDGEMGDIGPEHPELEKQLFGSENHVKTGVRFDTIAVIPVVQEGHVQIQPIRTFRDAGLHPAMLRNVELAGYAVPTPIQSYTIPAVLQGHDVIACAQTGSGKTAAFLIPILSKLMGKAKKLAAPRPNPAMVSADNIFVRAEPLVLIVAPTRELATQIFDEARRFCYRTMFRPCAIYGGGPISEQIKQLAKGCDILIGTPGRLCDFLDRPHLLTLKRLKYMVIDEADEMVGSDWDTELRKIMSGGDQDDGNINYLMFSATFPKMARDLAKNHLAHSHVRFRVGRLGSTHSNIKQDILDVDPRNKRKCLTDLLISMPPCRTIIFVNSKRTCDEVDDHLFNLNFPCTSIHGGRTQREREDSIRAFRSGKAPILIATGVSARGLDIHNVNHIINYDLPSSNFGGIQEYIHRIGRTGRIGNVGVATSFYNSRDEDLAPMLVKLLLENNQKIPEFLTPYLPEGFTVEEGLMTTGEIDKIDWEDNSDNGEGGENVDGGDGENAGVWGEPVSNAGAWGADTASQPAQASSWEADVITQPSQASGGRGVAPHQPNVDAQVQAPSQGWNVATAAPQPTWGAQQIAPSQTQSTTTWEPQSTVPSQSAQPTQWDTPAPVKTSPQLQKATWDPSAW